MRELVPEKSRRRRKPAPARLLEKERLEASQGGDNACGDDACRDNADGKNHEADGKNHEADGKNHEGKGSSEGSDS